MAFFELFRLLFVTDCGGTLIHSDYRQTFWSCYGRGGRCCSMFLEGRRKKPFLHIHTSFTSIILILFLIISSLEAYNVLTQRLDSHCAHCWSEPIMQETKL